MEGTWEELRNQATVELLKVLGMETPSRTDLNKARLATSALASVTRHEATESSRERTAVVAARLLTSNEEDFRRYVSVAAPRLSLPPREIDDPTTGTSVR